MNKKCNYLIPIEEKSEKSDIAEYINLPNNYSISVGDLKIFLKYPNNAIFVKSKDENIIVLFALNIYQDDLFDYVSDEEYLLEKYFLDNKIFCKIPERFVLSVLCTKRDGRDVFC
jgi:hypothetical protein